MFRRPHFFARPPAGAFTLLELLTVIAIIAILAGLGFGAARRASEAGRMARARMELTLLGGALENYRQATGDYPQTDDPARLLQAVLGRRGPLYDRMDARPFLELTRFTVADGRDPLADEKATLLDPWGHAYGYAYRAVPSWRNSRYVLYSAGPDGQAAAVLLDGGFPETLLPDNTDNLYADRL